MAVCEKSSTGKHVPGEVYGPSSIDGKFRRRCVYCGKVIATRSEKDKLQNLEVLFKKSKEATRASLKAHIALTEAEEEYYGFNHVDRDMDDIIDAVDFDQGRMSFSQFHKRMMQEMKK